MKIFLSICILFSLNFCSKKNRVTYWELSKFRIEPAALSDNDHVKILYFSNGQESTSEYYYHAICVSETTGDTVNILMPIPNGIDQSSAGKVFRFSDEQSYIYKVGSSDISKLSSETLNNGLKTPVRREKVYRDPTFDDIADNKFPAVIGLLSIEQEMPEHP